ncbi:MAG: anthranilate phosphoribosyltransferase [Planctomycetaceae bacterium]|nr:anthranilate phosphoribosyltransferase [Planctomycetaceae bacterium]
MTSSASPDFASVLQSLVEGRSLPEETMRELILAIMSGGVSEALIASLLTALRMKPEAVSEITGTARAMLELASRIPTARTGLLDTCGTGGDELHTFNISTATAIVVAACEVPVAKHGNRSVSSSSGSSEVLETLGVNVQLTPEQVGACVDQIGIGFCFAPLFHSAMKHVAPIRKQLRFRTIFNLVGPLVNPAGAEYQLLGVGRPETARLLAESLRNLGRARAIVVCGAGQLDEVALWGETLALLVEGNQPVRELKWAPSTFGLSEIQADQLKVGSPAESATVIKNILAGQPGPARSIVLANAAAALAAVGRIPVDDLAQGVAMAAHALDSGAAANKLAQLCQLSNSFQR